MDSAIEAERLHRELKDPTIKLITRLSIEEDDEKRNPPHRFLGDFVQNCQKTKPKHQQGFQKIKEKSLHSGSGF